MLRFKKAEIENRPILRIVKASPRLQYQVLHAVVDALMPVMRAGLAKGFTAMKSRVNLYEIVEALETGKTHLINAELINWDKIDTDLRAQLKGGLGKGVIRGGKAEKEFFVDAVRRIIPEITEVEIPFTLDNPRVSLWINQRVDWLTGRMEAEGVKAVQDVTAMFYDRGYAPRDAAKAIKGAIGLNQRQAVAVARYRQNLIKDNIGTRQIDKLVGQYERRSIKYRAEMISRTESVASVMRGQQATWEQAADAGFIEEQNVQKEWIVTPDDVLCEHCQELNRVTVKINDVFQSGAFGAVDSPPLHPNCYDKETEVLTDTGWKYFENCDVKTDKFLSVDLETGTADYVKAKNKIKYWFHGQMHVYKSRYCDLKTTPNHTHVVRFRNRGNKGRKNHSIWLKESGETLPKCGFSFLATIPNWQGKNPKKLKIGGNHFDTKTFVEFIGYYLSEGSISKPKSGSWQIKISQNNQEKKAVMLKCAAKIFDKIWVSKECFYIPLYKREIIDWFLNLGKSHQKYIPLEIKNLSIENLKIFLNAYLLGDGHIKAGKMYKNHLFSESKMYFTSSDKMAADIGELILKIGKRPSYRIGKAKVCKHTCWVISECNQTAYQVGGNMKKIDVDYSDYVHCVELEKYHTLIVRRGGRVIISGNCRCVMRMIFDK